MQIRRIKPSDSQKLLDYFINIVQLDPQRVERYKDVITLTVQDEIHWIEQRIKSEQSKEMVVLCCEIENQIVAVGEVERKKRWIERHVGEIRFAVLPAYKKLAFHLLEKLIEKSKNIEIEVLIYFHLSSQLNGIELVEMFDFAKMGTVPNYYKLENGTYVNRLYYYKIL